MDRLFAPYAEMLKKAGWPADAIHSRGDLEMRVLERPASAAHLYEIRRGGRPIVSIAVLEKTRFPSGVALYRQYLDAIPEGRLCLGALRRLSPASKALLLTEYECCLYDLANEELLVSTISPEETEARVISALAPGALDGGYWESLPRRGAMQWGKDLGAWMRVWSAKIGRQARMPPDALLAMIAHWLMAWRHAKFADGEWPGVEIAIGSGMASARLVRLTPAQFLEQRLGAVRRRFPFGIFKAYARREDEMWTNLEARGVLSDFLAEAVCISAGKLESKNALWAFSDEALEHNAWKAALTQDLRVGRLLRRDDLTITDPIVADVAQSGYGWPLTLIEELTRYWIEENLKRKAEIERRGPIGLQLDFLRAEPAGLHPQGYIADVAQYALINSFRVRTRTAEDRIALGALIAMKMMELCERYVLPLGDCPGIDAVFDAG
ncbi:MAG: hypothetical protein BWZ10_00882 [candidate division BRC1 bacterium ADurb.BinA364]|nr:MAG: hypothetical protein BWZ10_00882 [candidate division BRC1 bacterium ADurb.BinA364]